VKKRLLLLFIFAIAAVVSAGPLPPIQTVFIILLENEDWSSIQNSTNAPYINHTLLPMASYCGQYFTPPGLHPSLPNYLWLESGTNFGILDDNDPSIDHQATTNHLVTLLNNAGISWRAYEEDISGAYVPLTNTNRYAVRHNPFAYFDDITGTNNPNYAYGIAHIRPYTELAGDLTGNNVARYNFITPNVCDDGHDSCAPLFNPVLQSDTWLSNELPKILSSAAYSNNGAVFITWDEGGNGPVGMIVLSPLARGGGYFNNTYYTHGSTLRTFQEIFGVGPLLNDAATETDLSDLFSQYNITAPTIVTNGFQLTVGGVVPGRTNIIEASPNLVAWGPISTNVSATNNFKILDSSATNLSRQFYRAREIR
jgi:hypothetical protein